MNLERYWSIFERNEVKLDSTDRLNFFLFRFQIDYLTFLSMTEQDLTQIGIEAFGIRRRLQQAIAGRKQFDSLFFFISQRYFRSNNG